MSLLVAFFAIALLYASVGFGGGSSYTALLISTGTAIALVPVISLLCNIVVVSGGVWHFHRAGAIDYRFMRPLLIGSVPAAWLGGAWRISESHFVLILGAALLLAGAALIFDRRRGDEPSATQRPISAPGLFLLGLTLGGLAGITGIGGGIYLSPVLHLWRAAPAQLIAASASVFILINSLSGLAGHLMKQDVRASIAGAADYWFLPVAVLIGGQLGSRIAVLQRDGRWIRRLTGALIAIVGLRLLRTALF